MGPEAFECTWEGPPVRHAHGLPFYNAFSCETSELRVAVGDRLYLAEPNGAATPVLAEILRLWQTEAHGMLSELRFYVPPEDTELGRQHLDGDDELIASCRMCVVQCSDVAQAAVSDLTPPQLVSYREYCRLKAGAKFRQERLGEAAPSDDKPPLRFVRKLTTDAMDDSRPWGQPPLAPSYVFGL